LTIHNSHLTFTLSLSFIKQQQYCKKVFRDNNETSRRKKVFGRLQPYLERRAATSHKVCMRHSHHQSSHVVLKEGQTISFKANKYKVWVGKMHNIDWERERKLWFRKLTSMINDYIVSWIHEWLIMNVVQIMHLLLMFETNGMLSKIYNLHQVWSYKHKFPF